MIIYLEHRGYSIELPQGDTVLGRDIGCNVRFNDAGVSRRHVRVGRIGDDVIIEDLGSTNGTFLNGNRVATRLPLADRDAIELGGYKLLVRMFDEEAEQRDTVRIMTMDDLEDRPDPDVARARWPTTEIKRVDPPED